MVGSGAGGSVAAAYLQTHGAGDVGWYEAGPDESARLEEHPAAAGASYPTSLHAPLPLTMNGAPLPYQIPLTTGGMTAHYQGVQFWTHDDVVRGLALDGAGDLEALTSAT